MNLPNLLLEYLQDYLIVMVKRLIFCVGLLDLFRQSTLYGFQLVYFLIQKLFISAVH